MFLIGSGIYQVIHSAIVVFTAILSRIFLNKKFTIQQWFSLIVIKLNFFFKKKKKKKIIL